MRITAVRTTRSTVALARPFKTAVRVCTAVESVLVQVEGEDGLFGYGEAPDTAMVTGETCASIQRAIEGHIGPAIIGMPIDEMDAVMEKLHGCIHCNTSAKAAVDMALYDLFSQQCGLPLYQLLGGYRRQIETDITISLNDAKVMVQDSLAAVNQGHTILKIKVGQGDETDFNRILEIYRAVEGKAVVRIDANQGWGAKEAVSLLRRLEVAGVKLDLVEQPVPAQDIEGLCMVTKNVLTPVLADESVFSARDAVHIIQQGAADLLNIKLMKTGGIYEALKVCAIAESFGVECMMGCMLESKIAVSAAAHLAAAKRIITRTDLDGPDLCAEDPCQGGPTFCSGRISMPGEPGIGFTQVRGFI